MLLIREQDESVKRNLIHLILLAKGIFYNKTNIGKVLVKNESFLLPNNENGSLNPLSFKIIIFISLKYDFVCFIW